MPGLLVLMGGDEFRADCLPMDRQLLARSGRQPPRVVIVPTAAARENPRKAAEDGIRYFEALGAHAAAALIVTPRDAGDPALAAPLAEADIVYLTGGNPRYLLDTLSGSHAWAAIRGRWQAGATLIGSSAGAMALAGTLAYGGPPVEALGAAPNLMVIPHFNAPGDTLSHLIAAAGLPAGVSVLGIPTATAALTTDGRAWQVLGARPVAVYPPAPASMFLADPGEDFRLAG